MGIFVVFLVLVLGTVYFTKQMIWGAYSTHEKLKILKERAREAKTKKEIEVIWDEFAIVVKRECWHHSFNEPVTEIKSILKTKYELLED